MKLKLFALFLLLLTSNSHAMEFPIEISEYIDDVKVDAFISPGVISEESKWTPFFTAPPLSINDALKAVNQYIDADPNYSHASLIGIELKPIPHHEDYWHYLVKLKTINEGNKRFRFIVVLMDGKVISAFREPESIK